MSSNESRRLLVVAGTKAMEMTQNNVDEAALIMRFAQEMEDTGQLLGSTPELQGGVRGRPWFLRYVMQQNYIASPD